MITKEIIKKLTPNARPDIIDDLVKYLNLYMPKYEVNTYYRVCHFLAQAAHESAGFRTLQEYASGAAYEGRKNLGNTKAGDGVRFKGRGIFQLTGRSNYRDMGNRLNIDLENKPELAENPEISVLTALEYWNGRKLSIYADRDDIVNITTKINGGTNGLDDRKNYLNRIKKILPKDFSFNKEEEKNIIVAKRGDNSPLVKDIQNLLIKKGCTINADGKFGPMTEASVKFIQRSLNLPVNGIVDTITLNKLKT